MIQLLPTLVSNIAVASALALLATVVGWSGRRAALARWIWLAVFLKLVTPPLVAVPVQFSDAWSGQLSKVSNYLSTPRVVLPAMGLQQNSDTLVPASGSQTTDVAHSVVLTEPVLAISVVDVLLVIWCVGAFWLLIRGAVRYWRMVRLLRSQAEVCDEGTDAVRKILHRAHGSFVPVVRLIPARISPMLFGLGRNTSIVCPRDLWRGLDEPQRLSFLAHEAAHYIRRDHWVRWVEWTVTSLYWWLPLVYWARLQLERHEEVACDDAALDLLQQRTTAAGRRNYAESLLSVVDFLSEAETRSPRLASRMQPTAALEERLHWIMSGSSLSTNWRGSLWVGLCIGGLSLLIHPTPRTWEPAPGYTAATMRADVHDNYSSMVVPSMSEPRLSKPPVAGGARSRPQELPPAPLGWWNHAPEPTWADRRLGQEDLRLVAQAGGSISVTGPSGAQSTFDPQDVRGLAYLAGNDRLVLGRSNGELHIWDVAAAKSISLIGKHSSGVSSVCWSEGGLVSSDRQGTIVRWDLQSGEMLASTNLNQAVSCVRWSNDGREVLALTGSWASAQGMRQAVVLAGASLGRLRAIRVRDDTATVKYHANFGWLAISWAGLIYQLDSSRVVGSIPKHQVTGAVLSADLMPDMVSESADASVTETQLDRAAN